MKHCIHCNQDKPLVEFYRDGKDNYCKTCRLSVNRANYVASRSKSIGERGAVSTIEARDRLIAQGISTVMGGNGWIDLLAWGCIPIEAKYSPGGVEGNPNKYSWSFTPRQRKMAYTGLFIFMAGIRSFVVPANVNWITDNTGVPLGWGLNITFGSKHSNAYLGDLITPYEDRWDLVEQYRVQWSNDAKRAR